MKKTNRSRSVQVIFELMTGNRRIWCMSPETVVLTSTILMTFLPILFSGFSEIEIEGWNEMNLVRYIQCQP